jgi:hypothetical protein
MTHSSIDNVAEVWNFTTTRASLSIAALRGSVTLDDPAQGIGELVWNCVPNTGHILGVSAGAAASPHDAFARGHDLVAVYAQDEPQSFQWQVYWRATTPEPQVVLIDVILSLQTPLLESFPRVITQSRLPTGEAKELPGEGDCLVLRPTACDWSYAEMTHPKDRGILELTPYRDGGLCIERRLGGQFLEKGVIRRLRLRGAFLPRKDDLDRAAGYLEQLAMETPPLTA